MEASTANVRITLPPWLTWGYTAVTNYTEDRDTDLVDQSGETPNYFDIKVQHGPSSKITSCTDFLSRKRQKIKLLISERGTHDLERIYKNKHFFFYFKHTT